MHLDDTIVAIATPAGRGGIGIVRLAGSEARAIAAPMLRLPRVLEANRAIFGELIEPATGERLDEVVVTFFARPHSYTTDDVVEISAHGSQVVLRHIVQLALAAGARLAEPGEFTLRAFLNGRLDLTQAEAVRDLIDAQTLFQAKVAAQQLEGALSHRIAPIKALLVELIALLEAGIDFADDDVAVMPSAQILDRIAAVRAPLAQLESSFGYGKLVHEGLSLAIVGRPNVGKSSLFNRLVERDRAIVTATPGTTRDLVTETVAIGGIPVRLIDTAGIRRTHDEAEAIGVRKSREALADADIVLVVLEATSPRTGEDEELLRAVADRRAIAVANKCDLAVNTVAPHHASSPANGNSSVTVPHAPDAAHTTQHAGSGLSPVSTPSEAPHHRPMLPEGTTPLRTSAITGEGIDALRQAILALAGAGAPAESGFLTNLRQQALVHDAIAALDAACTSTAAAVPHEMLLLDLYNALRALDEITGATTSDDILNLIFGTFCIGK